MKTDSQNKKLLEHLKVNLTINPMEAWNRYGIYRLSARIHDLRHKYNCIITTDDREGYAVYTFGGQL
jgi:hypothetical protein